VIFALLIAAGALFWAWRRGRLQTGDGLALLVGAIALELALKGRVALAGGLAAALGGWWLLMRRRPVRRAGKATPRMPAETARTLLGVTDDADDAAIRAAHRRLIARVHPDSGGSPALAAQVNAARDTLLAELNRDRRQAS